MKLSSIFKLRKWAGLVATSRFSRFLSDRRHIKLTAYASNLDINLDNPKTYNDKLQWLKLHDRRPEYTTMVDKYVAKDYIASKIGAEYIIPTLGVWDKFDDIDFDLLPDKFVLKCTHDSGGLIICRDKSKFDVKEARNKIQRSLKRNYYWMGREWPYKNVKPRIIAEEFMQDSRSENLPVYKIFCFDGIPYLIQNIQNDKQPSETIDYFDTNWSLLDLRQGFPNSERPLKKPELLGEMLDIAKKLSFGHSFLRVDLYNVNGKIYFSEFTFYSDSGFSKFEPDEWDLKLGEKIKLPIKEGNLEL